MKKLLFLTLGCLLAIVLFSCSDSSSNEASTVDQTTAASLDISLVYSRDVSAQTGTYLQKANNELYWTYKAVKTDGGYATGATGTDIDTAEALPLKVDTNNEAVMGIPEESFGDFSYGEWLFLVEAYYYDGEELEANKTTFYNGVESEVTLSSTETTVTVTVTLAQADDATSGTLTIKDLEAYEEGKSPDDSSPFDLSTAVNYTYYYDYTSELTEDISSGLPSTWVKDEELAMFTDEGITLELDAGYYPLSIYIVTSYSDDDEEYYDIVASAYVPGDGVQVRLGAESTVTGYLVEQATSEVTMVVTLTYYEWDENNELVVTTKQLYPEE